jgi:hypothetical protein
MVRRGELLRRRLLPVDRRPLPPVRSRSLPSTAVAPGCQPRPRRHWVLLAPSRRGRWTAWTCCVSSTSPGTRCTELVPPELLRMPRLRVLDLSQNSLSGVLSGQPSSRGTSGIRHLDVSFNGLTSLEGDVFQWLPLLRNFSAESNRLTGVLPGSLVATLVVPGAGAPERGEQLPPRRSRSDDRLLAPDQAPRPAPRLEPLPRPSPREPLALPGTKGGEPPPQQAHGPGAVLLPAAQGVVLLRRRRQQPRRRGAGAPGVPGVPSPRGPHPHHQLPAGRGDARPRRRHPRVPEPAAPRARQLRAPWRRAAVAARQRPPQRAGPVVEPSGRPDPAVARRLRSGLPDRPLTQRADGGDPALPGASQVSRQRRRLGARAAVHVRLRRAAVQLARGARPALVRQLHPAVAGPEPEPPRRSDPAGARRPRGAQPAEPER